MGPLVLRVNNPKRRRTLGSLLSPTNRSVLVGIKSLTFMSIAGVVRVELVVCSYLSWAQRIRSPTRSNGLKFARFALRWLLPLVSERPAVLAQELLNWLVNESIVNVMVGLVTLVDCVIGCVGRTGSTPDVVLGLRKGSVNLSLSYELIDNVLYLLIFHEVLHQFLLVLSFEGADIDGVDARNLYLVSSNFGAL